MALFTALGLDLQIIEDAIQQMSIKSAAASDAQDCRSRYKDALTDRAVGEVLTHNDEHSSLLKHRELRQFLLKLTVELNNHSA